LPLLQKFAVNERSKMDKQEELKCVNCGKEYVSSEFLEIDNEVEVDGELVIRKDLICAECYFGN
jgi:hypothetical protein